MHRRFISFIPNHCQSIHYRTLPYHLLYPQAPSPHNSISITNKSVQQSSVVIHDQIPENHLTPTPSSRVLDNFPSYTKFLPPSNNQSSDVPPPLRIGTYPPPKSSQHLKLKPPPPVSQPLALKNGALSPNLPITILFAHITLITQP